MKFIIRLLINAIALWVIAHFQIAGVRADSTTALLIGAVVLGVANAVIKPILLVVSCPLEILTLGLFTLVINAIIFYCLNFISGWSVPGFWSAFWAAIVMSIISWILSMILGEDRKDATSSRGGGNT